MHSAGASPDLHLGHERFSGLKRQMWQCGGHFFQDTQLSRIQPGHPGLGGFPNDNSHFKSKAIRPRAYLVNSEAPHASLQSGDLGDRHLQMSGYVILAEFSRASKRSESGCNGQSPHRTSLARADWRCEFRPKLAQATRAWSFQVAHVSTSFLDPKPPTQPRSRDRPVHCL